MASEYNITFLYKIMDLNSGPSFSLTEADKGTLVLAKGPSFGDAFADMTPDRTKDDKPKPKCEADRAYLHYIIDCWLDDKPVDLQPSELP